MPLSTGETVELVVDKKSNNANWIAWESNQYHLQPPDGEALSHGEKWRCEVLDSDGQVTDLQAIEFITEVGERHFRENISQRAEYSSQGSSSSSQGNSSSDHLGKEQYTSSKNSLLKESDH